MSYDLERKIIEQAYKDEMPIGAAVQYGNTAFQAPSNGFTRINVISGGASRLLEVGSTGNRRYVGVIDVSIFVVTDAGTSGLRVIARQVEDALAHRAFYESGTRIVTFGSEFTVLGKSGDWYQGNVSIRYERDGAAENPSLRKFSGRRLFTFGGDRLNTFTDVADPSLNSFGGLSLKTFGGKQLKRFTKP